MGSIAYCSGWLTWAKTQTKNTTPAPEDDESKGIGSHLAGDGPAAAKAAPLPSCKMSRVNNKALSQGPAAEGGKCWLTGL